MKNITLQRHEDNSKQNDPSDYNYNEEDFILLIISTIKFRSFPHPTSLWNSFHSKPETQCRW